MAIIAAGLAVNDGRLIKKLSRSGTIAL
jgi:hypothetical protein